jgi:hypothetical protein
MQTNCHQNETVSIASLQILPLTSATLQTLYIDLQSMWQLIPTHLDVGTSPWRIRLMLVLRELKMRYGVLDDDEMDKNLFLDFGGEGRGEMVLLPQLRYLDLVGLRIRLHLFDLYKQISKFVPVLMHLRLPMPMAGGLEHTLGFGVGVSLDQGTEYGGVVLAEEQVTTTMDTTSNSNAPTIPTHFQSPAITTPTQKPSLLPTATLQHIYIQPPPAPKLHWGNNNFSYKREVYMLKVDELKAVESREERVVVLDCMMEDLRMEDIIRGWDRERGGDGL